MKIYRLTFYALAVFIFAACQSAAVNNQPLSPTATMKALNDASKKKDVAAIKNLVSKGTLDLLAQTAEQQKTTIDELLSRDEGAPFQELPETRNEQINGDTATVEIKNNATNDWETMPFVRENGVWKIALDRFMEDLMKRMTEEMKEVPAAESSPKASANSAVNK
jgi:hypothetical protein